MANPTRFISTREHLKNQGVTEEDAIRRHIRFIYDLQKNSLSTFDIEKYRVDPSNPNAFPPMMG